MVGLPWRLSALPPDAILATSGFSGALGTIQDDPDAPDGNWMVWTSGAQDIRMSFTDTGKAMNTDAGSQRIRILARKS